MNLIVYGDMRFYGIDNLSKHPDIRYIGRGLLSGYKLYNLGGYPTIKLTGYRIDEVIADMFRVPIELTDYIRDTFSLHNFIEISDEVFINDKYEVGILYIYRGEVDEEKVIPSGDWFYK